jgi:hypothetical protein
MFNKIFTVYYHYSFVAAAKFIASCIFKAHSVVLQDLSNNANRAGNGSRHKKAPST